MVCGDSDFISTVELRSAELDDFSDWIELIDGTSDDPMLWIDSDGRLSDSQLEKKYTFNIKVKTDDEENNYSNYHIYIYKCLKDNCMNCTFGTLDTEVCHECEAGYELNDDKECEQMTAVLIARFYIIIVCCLIMIIAMVTTYIGRAQNPAWLLIEFI